ncbi:hypothetical protein NM208_g6387 [Fusarium decemcellulare]|uniref:Uncharacterized protein n=1 Tax=Fusarium decemcellulare TaxID=57161 RepID=A0ACC1SD98_9HYPO|nr:hypothetical protein NM208_g6387 [Fusarium decemcellulare]
MSDHPTSGLPVGDQISEAYWPSFRTMIENDPSKMEGLNLECPICYEQMMLGGEKYAPEHRNDSEYLHRARALRCGHMFCHGCVLDFTQYRSTCPTCSTSFMASQCHCIYLGNMVPDSVDDFDTVPTPSFEELPAKCDACIMEDLFSGMNQTVSALLDLSHLPDQHVVSFTISLPEWKNHGPSCIGSKLASKYADQQEVPEFEWHLHVYGPLPDGTPAPRHRSHIERATRFEQLEMETRGEVFDRGRFALAPKALLERMLSIPPKSNPGEDTTVISETFWPHLRQTLVKNPSNFDRLDLPCSICFETMVVHPNQDGHDGHGPCILPCGHMLGSSCLTNILKYNTQARRGICCPTCRGKLKHRACGHVFEGLAMPTSVEGLEDIPLTISEGGRLSKRCIDCTVPRAVPAMITDVLEACEQKLPPNHILSISGHAAGRSMGPQA